jgi:cell division protein FtsI (penicillin-binding protein 3)
MGLLLAFQERTFMAHSEQHRASGSEKQFRTVAVLTAFGATAAMGLLLGRVAQLQLAPSPKLVAQMESRMSTKQDLPVRGDITDRRGRLIASTSFARRAVIDPTVFATANDLTWAVRTLAQATGLDEPSLRARIDEAIARNNERAMVAEEWKKLGRPPEGWLESQGLKEPEVSETPATDEEAKAEDESNPFSLGLNDPFASVQKRYYAKSASGASVGSLPGEMAFDGAKQGAPKEPQPPKPIRYLPISDVLTAEQEAALRTAISPPKPSAAERAAAKAEGRKLEQIPSLRGVVLERVQVRDFVAPPDVASLVGKVGFGHAGLMGAELRQEKLLGGDAGAISYVRDRWGRPLWIEDGFIDSPEHGKPVRLSIDLEIQAIATQELQAQVEKMNAAGGRIVILDSLTGEVLAMTDIVRHIPNAVPFPWVPVDEKGKRLHDGNYDENTRYIALRDDPARLIHPALGRNRCVEDVYEPGSTFKPFVWATITELGLIPVDKMIDTEGGRWRAPDNRPLTDVVERDQQTWGEVLVNSSNIGMVKGAQLLSYKQLHDCVRRFGFGERTGLDLPGETAGIVTRLQDWKLYTQVSVSYGHNIAVTPVQMARAFAVFSKPGAKAGLLSPIRLTASDDTDAAPVAYRVLPADLAIETRDIMAKVVESVERRWMKDETPPGGWRYTLFGKSGTALIPLGAPPKGFARPKAMGTKSYLGNQFISSFVAAGPVENPRLVCVAIIDDPGPAPAGVSRKSRYGSSAAGPIARKALERSLTYLGVPPSPKPEESVASSSNN